jgi:hypothetical protein
LFHSRYSPKLADFVPSLWYGREGAGHAQQLAAQALPNSLKSVKTAGIAPKYVQKKSFDDTDDRHSKNTFSPPLPNTARR